MAVLGITCRRRHGLGLRHGLTADRPRMGTAGHRAPTGSGGRARELEAGKTAARRGLRIQRRRQWPQPLGASESRPVMRSAPARPPPTSRRYLARTLRACHYPLPVATSRERRLLLCDPWNSEKLHLPLPSSSQRVKTKGQAHTGGLFCVGCTAALQNGSSKPGRENAALAWPKVPTRPLPLSPQREKCCCRLENQAGRAAGMTK